MNFFEHHGNRVELVGLVGRELALVTFVRGYVQLGFDGPLITAVTLPTIETVGGTVAHTSPAYCDMLVAQIGKRVATARVDPEVDLCVRFEDGTIVRVSLLDKDRVADEAVLVRGADEADLAIW